MSDFLALGIVSSAGVAGVLAALFFRARFTKVVEELEESHLRERKAEARVKELIHISERIVTECQSTFEAGLLSLEHALGEQSRARAEITGVAEGISLIANKTDSNSSLGDVRRQAELLVREQADQLTTLRSETQNLFRDCRQSLDLCERVVDLVKGMDSGIDDLRLESLEAVRASTQMDDLFRRVSTGASDTASISSKVSTEAERGYRAVHRTLDEIERIRELTKTAREQIDALGVRVVGIGDVVQVIQEIAEKTNLLALNASIIASRAGEHGRGFAVVAQEIKKLALRTANSTKEIGAQIHGVQEESQRAMDSMATGVDAVGEGFQVALGAGDALGEIRQSARSAQKKVTTITRAMKEQSNESSRVVAVAGKLSEKSHTLGNTVRGRTDEGNSLRESVHGLSKISERINQMVMQRTSSGRSMNEFVSTIAQQLAGVQSSGAELNRHLTTLKSSVERIRNSEDEAQECLKRLSRVANEMRAQLERVNSVV